MPTYQKTPGLDEGLPESSGVLLVNLGTPDAPTTTAVRRFLRQFLSDPRVVELPRLPWWLILNLAILPIRSPRSAAAYRKVWTDDGSPLLSFSRELADAIAKRMPSDVTVRLAMNYGEPSINAGIDALLAAGVRRILVLPLYPQYSGTTSASAFDAVARKLAALRWVPDNRFIGSYHDEPGYIGALANSVREHWSAKGRGDKLMMSFHGVPVSTITGGDPYLRQCQETARLLAADLELSDDEWVLTFQSRVGRQEWLQPYTDATVTALAGDGLRRLDVICPGFSADCLETLEEIAMENAEIFLEAGGSEFSYIPALNGRGDHADMLAGLVERNLAGWRDSDTRSAPPVLVAAES